MTPKALSWLALIPLALFGIAVAFGLGYVYHLAHYWNPLIILSIFFPVVFAVVLCTLAAKLLSVSNCESLLAGAIIGLAIGISALSGKYWIPYQMEISNAAAEVIELGDNEGLSYDEVRDLISSQTSLTDYMSLRAESGFGIISRSGSLPVGGTFMWVLWAIEASIIVLFTTMATPGNQM